MPKGAREQCKSVNVGWACQLNNKERKIECVLSVNPTQDPEIVRQKKNLTASQKRNADLTKEGVVVNSLIKEPKNFNMDDVYDSMVISNNAQMPEKIYENKITKDKSILPISFIATGVMATMALISLLAKRSAKANLTLKASQKLPSLTRNLSINEETHQAIYQMVQCPNQKTILAGAGVLTIGAMAFMGKMFIDGFKDVWVKRREADIQKNLQEKLIAVETQSFSGKMQIMRSMLSDKAKEFSDYLCPNPLVPTAFKSFHNSLKFQGQGDKDSKTSKKSENENAKYLALGAVTLGTIVGLGFVSLKNLRSSKKYLEKYVGETKQKVSDIISKSDFKTKEFDKINLKNMLQAIDAEPNYIYKELAKLKWNKAEKDGFIEEIAFNTKKSTAQANQALGGDGTPKPAFYSHVNDYRAFFYNWILDTSNPLFRNLFLGITGITAVSYGGKVLGEAVKDVQVKKINAQTELELQQRLVSTELRNFKAKKDAAINPLCDEFYVQLERGKPKEEMKVIAENILFEVKNGPPFVYS